MSEILWVFILILFLFCLLGAGVWVAFSLLAVGMLTMVVFSSAPIGEIMATTIWGSSNSWALSALPLFIWMGEILFRSRLSKDLFTGVAPWVIKFPGKLLHVNIFSCAIFAAISGSSAATAVTIGKLTIPELSKRKYPEQLMIGTLTGSTTLGLLIPPSIVLIVYGVATDQSIAKLFVAGILPGLLLVLLFVIYIFIWSLMNKGKLPEEKKEYSLVEKIKKTKYLLPVIILIAAILGSIYSGIASPTDAAALGVVFALIFSYMSGSMNREVFVKGLLEATKTSCMIAFILAGASFLTVAMGFAGIPKNLAIWIAGMNLSQYELLFALTIFFIIMGCFLDGISVVVLTTSVIMPMVETVGIDPLWFGIFLVIVVEMSQITPPVGFNLFVLQSLTGRNIFSIAKASLPFFALMLLALLIIVLVPGIVTYLPYN